MKNTTMKQNEQKINETLNYLAGFDPDEKERHEQEYPMAGYDDEDTEDILYDAIDNFFSDEDDKAEAFDLIIDYFEQKLNEINDKIDMLASKQSHQFCKIVSNNSQKMNRKQMVEALKNTDDADVRYEAFEILIDYFEQKINDLNEKLDAIDK